MSNFPNSFDDDTTLPVVNDNITEIGGEAINALRDFAFNTEQYLGLGLNGSTPSLAARLGVSINPDGTLMASAIASMGLVTLPITQDMIANNAGIPESKLFLDYRTGDLFNYIRDLSKDVNNALGWISTTGVQLEPHLIGAIYRHSMDQIDVSHDLVNFPYLINKFRLLRDNLQSYSLVNDINNELLAHQWADGSPFGSNTPVITNDGSQYPANYAHLASGIFINTSRFAVIPQTNDDLQSFADYIDQSSILLLGTRVQNLYANGISRNSQSSSLTADGYGQPLVPVTAATAYLRGSGNQSIPFDDINTGDDIIQFFPSADVLNSNLFDEQFSNVKVGDIVTVNYVGDGYNIEVQWVINEKKYIPPSGLSTNKTFLVRIAGKNLMYSQNATARIDRTLFNNKKFGVLAAASGVPVDPTGNSLTGTTPSLVVASPRGAQCLGLGFAPDELNESHYLLYLVMYADGNPLDGYTVLPAIDVTGNAGTTPGSYTLDSVIEATNQAFRAPGYNYRFIAFERDGEFGVMLADSYNNTSFSIVSGVVDGSGVYNQPATQLFFPNNVVDLFPVAPNLVAPDPLGLGPNGASVASPLFQSSYPSAFTAQIATKVFPPLRRNNYYVNGTERERLTLDVGQALDQYGDGYWVATVQNVSPVSGPPGYTNVAYEIPLDLSASGLKAGKTLVVQPIDGYSAGVNFGRFVIQNVTFTCCPPVQTLITVYDAVHGTGTTPAPVNPVGSEVAIYFNSDSVSFNNETATDFGVVTAPFRRFFELYIDQNGNTFTHERSRFSPAGQPVVNNVTLYNTLSIANLMNVMNVSPKLRGYQFGSVVKINLQILSLDSTTGIYTGFLSSFDGVNNTHEGPLATGKIGEMTRFYDVTQADYIDVIFDFSGSLSDISSGQWIDIQLFPTLELDGNLMLLNTCQVDESTNNVTHLVDRRDFGNTSEEQFTTSALNYISAPDRLLHFNGTIRGFDVSSLANGFITISGGLAMVNGNLTYVNDQVLTIPKIAETPNFPINFALCVRGSDSPNGDLILHPLTDFDPVLGTPSSGDRIMNVTNKVYGNPYDVDSNSFSYILNNRKDLTILYIVSSIVTGGGSGAAVSASIRDVRRFINDSDASIIAVLTNGNSQGNFRDLAAALNWIKFNNTFQNTLQIKGSYTIATDPGLNFPLAMTAAGAGASLTFNIPGSFSISDAVFSGLAVSFGTLTTSVALTDCVFTAGALTIPSVGATLTNVSVTDAVVTINGLITPVGATAFVNCIINVPIQQAFVITSGLVFENCIFNYTFNAAGAIGYNGSGDLVNAGSGLMYTNVSGVLNDFTVNNCIFTYSFPDHFPMISIQMGGVGPGFSYGAICHNVNITNNQFLCIPLVDDRRAVVSIVSTCTTANSGPNYPPFPKLVKCSISENLCSHDQMILLSTVRVPGAAIVGAMIACVDVDISNNVCGAIGYMTASDFTSNDFNSVIGNIGAIRDKSDQLTISENNCKLIVSLDSLGQFVAFHDPSGNSLVGFPGDHNWVKAGTGAVSIVRNTCNWINVGQATWTNGNTTYTAVNSDGVIISQNRVTPGNIAVLSSYTDTLNSGLAVPFNGIQLRQCTSQQSDYLFAQGAIINNILTGKVLLQPNGVFDAYGYNIAIRCDASAQVVGNTIRSAGGNPTMIMLGGDASGGPIIRCTNNTLIRGSNTVVSYITGFSPLAINNVVISDNTFDQPTTDGSNIAVGLNIPIAWTYKNNVNQTNSMIVSMTDSKFMLPNADGIYTGGGPPGVGGRTPTGPAYGATTIYEDTNMRVGRIISQSPWQAGSNYVYVQSPPNGTGVAPNQNNISFTVPLDNYLPNNVKITSVSMGIFLRVLGGTGLNTGSSSGVPFNMCTLTLIGSCGNFVAGGSPGGIMDVAANVFFGFGGFSNDDTICFRQGYTTIVSTTDASGSDYNQVQQVEIATATKYNTIFPTQTLTTGQNYKLHAEVSLGWQIADSSSQVAWYFSPILVTYRW